MRNYFVRTAKHLLFVIIVSAVVFLAMDITNYNKITPQMFDAFMASREAVIMILALAALVLTHPFVGYTKRSFSLDFNKDRDIITKTFAIYGYVLTNENDQIVQFRAANKLNRIFMMNEDTITITKSSFENTIEGKRKMVVRIVYRLSA